MSCFIFIVVKPNIISKDESLLKLKLFEIDLSKADNFPSAKNMNIWFVASMYIEKFIEKDAISKAIVANVWKCEFMCHCCCE